MKFLYGFLIYCVAQILVWFQTYGPLKIDFIKSNKWLIYVFSIPITYLFVTATRYTVEYFEGLTWGSRFIQFTAGIITFAVMSYIFNNEGINLKTGISLLIVTILILIQTNIIKL